MHKEKILTPLILLFSLPIAAQQEQTFSGSGVTFRDHTLKVSYLGPLQRRYPTSWQGMAVWDRWIVSLQDHGVATIFDYNGKTTHYKGRMKLGSYQEGNHANVCFFGPHKLNPDDHMPLLYVSHCAGHTYLYAEQIDPVRLTARRVQTIRLQDEEQKHGSTAQWVYDCAGNYLYAFGSTTGSKGIGNRHWILKFPMPEYHGPQDSTVILMPKDALEDYQMEETYGIPFSPLLQGGCIHNGLLYMPTGAGRHDLPSILYVWDLGLRHMRNVINLQKVLPYEMEDCAVHGGALIMQCHDGIYKIENQE